MNGQKRNEPTDRIREKSQGDFPKSYAVQECEQGCLASAEQCEESHGNSEEACSSEFLTCIDNCRVLLTPPA